MTLLLKFALLWIVASLVVASLLSRFWPRRYQRIPDPPRTLDLTGWKR